MKDLGADIDSFLREKKNPTSERAHLIQQICDSLFDDTHFKKVFGQTAQFTVPEIRGIFDTARSWETNPQALFWKLVREKQGAVRKQMEQ